MISGTKNHRAVFESTATPEFTLEAIEHSMLNLSTHPFDSSHRLAALTFFLTLNHDPLQLGDWICASEYGENVRVALDHFRTSLGPTVSEARELRCESGEGVRAKRRRIRDELGRFGHAQAYQLINLLAPGDIETATPWRKEPHRNHSMLNARSSEYVHDERSPEPIAPRAPKDTRTFGCA